MEKWRNSITGTGKISYNNLLGHVLFLTYISALKKKREDFQDTHNLWWIGINNLDTFTTSVTDILLKWKLGKIKGLTSCFQNVGSAVIESPCVYLCVNPSFLSAVFVEMLSVKPLTSCLITWYFPDVTRNTSWRRSSANYQLLNK